MRGRRPIFAGPEAGVWRARQNRPDRQKSLKNEIDALFKEDISLADFMHDWRTMYGASNDDLRVILDLGLHVAKRGTRLSSGTRLTPGVYAKFLTDFFPIVGEDETDPKIGYKPSEIAGLLKSWWWFGDNVSGFEAILNHNPNQLFARYSGSDRRAIVLGWMDNERKKHLMKYLRGEHNIVAEGFSYRTIQSLAKAFANAQGLSPMVAEAALPGEEENWSRWMQ